MFRGFHKRYIFLTVALLAAFPLQVQAQIKGPDCSYLVVNRTYANAFGGFINVPTFFGPSAPYDGLVPDAGAGFLTFQPGGKVSNTETLAIGILGLHQDLRLNGTYSISWNSWGEINGPIACTGTMSLTATLPMPPGVPPVQITDEFRLLVASDGQRIETIHTNPGLMVGTTMLPMSTAGCSNYSIAGKYSDNAQGWMLTQPGQVPSLQQLSLYIPFVFSGVFQFHPGVPGWKAGLPDTPAGAGFVEGWDSASLSSYPLPVSRELSGWYDINPDCTGTMSVRDTVAGNPDEGIEFQLEMFVGENGTQVYLVNTNPGPTTPVPDVYVPAMLLGTTLERLDDFAHVPKDSGSAWFDEQSSRGPGFSH